MKFTLSNFQKHIAKNKAQLLFCSIVFVSMTCSLFGQGNLNNKTPKVIIVNEDLQLSLSIIEDFKNIINTVYPKLVKDFNKNARMDLSVKIDTSYNGVAYAHNGRVTVSSKWLHKNPEDIDLMTHEIMHIIQSYPPNAGPGWLTEGIADFVRYKYGVNNANANWSLPKFSQKQSYKDSYRVTARFLLWITLTKDKKIVSKLDKNLRSNTYSPKLWEKYTGLNLDQLWVDYGKNPIIK